MKKPGLIIGISVLLLAILIGGAGFWLKGHMQTVARSLIGRDIHFASLDLSYFPMPTIVLTDLELKEGPHVVKVPELTLYPDFGEILSGRINFKKTVLEAPLVVAKGLDAQGQTAATAGHVWGDAPFSMGSIPEGMLIVNRGRLVLQASHGGILPVDVTAQAEKIDQHLSIQLKNATIEEIGLQFVGDVTITSISPLKLKLNATQGTFKPDAVKDFLYKFGYLSDELADRIPTVQKIDAEGLTVDFDAVSGSIRVEATHLTVDQTDLQNVTVALTDGKSFAVDCSQGDLDAQSIYGLLRMSADGRLAVDEMLARAKLKSLSPEGPIRFSDLHLNGSLPPTDGGPPEIPLNGGVDLSVEGLVLQLEALNGQTQQITIGSLESKVIVEKGRPSVQVKQLTFDSSRGGEGRISGSIAFPPDLEQTVINSSIDGLRVFDSTLDFHLNKGRQPKSVFDLKLKSPSINVSADGMVYIPGRGQTDLEARLTHLRIAGSKKMAGSQRWATPVAMQRPFDTRMVVNKNITAKAFVKTFQFGDLTRLQDVNLRLEAANNSAVLNGTIRLCGVNLTVGAFVMPPSRLVTTLETKGTDVDLTSLIACFSNELPVYLAGRLFISGSFAADGETPQALMEGALGEMTVTVTQAAVRRISGLDSRLSFFLDILRAARISTDKEDSIALSRGVVNANLHAGQLVLDRFSLVGPLLNAWGKGVFTIKDRRLKLSGGVRTAYGVTQGLDIDRILLKGGA